MNLLQKGVKYSLHTKRENWIQNLAFEAETAIKKLPTSDRELYRHMVAKRINTLQKNNNTQSIPNSAIREAKTMKSIQSKLRKNDANITRADKGNSTVILPTEQYNSKLQEFIQNNNFETGHTDPTKTFQLQVRNIINNSGVLIPKETRWKYTNINLSAPTIKGY